MDVRDCRTVHRLPRSISRSFAERRPGSIGHITLRGKCAGARSAGKPHAACDVAGAGNGLTVRLVRHSHRKRGETDRPRLRSTAPALDPTGHSKGRWSPSLLHSTRRCLSRSARDGYGTSRQLTPIPLSRADADPRNVLHEDDPSILVAGSSLISRSSSLWKGQWSTPHARASRASARSR